MALAGTLKDFGLADIFQLIGMQKKTGVLTLEAKSETVKVLFKDGKIVHADTDAKESQERLGTVLVKRGLITDQQLQSTLEKQGQTLQRLGHILVKDRILTREQMQDALYRQVTQVLYRLFRWKDGEYKFSQEDTLDYDTEFFVPIPPESILMEGVQMMDEWPIIEKKIRSMSLVLARAEMGEGKVLLREDAGEEFEDSFDWTESGDDAISEVAGDDSDVIHLAPHEWQIYQAVDGERTVRDVCYRSPLNEFGTCRTLYDLLSRNLILEVGTERDRDEPSVRAAPVGEPRGVLSALGYMIIFAVFLAAMGTFWMNPVGPTRWLTRPQGPASSIGGDVSRLRLERLNYAIQVCALEYGVAPASLDELVEKRFLYPRDLVDPWGTPYTYQIDGGEYTLTGFDADGQVDPDLIVIGNTGVARAVGN